MDIGSVTLRARPLLPLPGDPPPFPARFLAPERKRAAAR